MTDTPKIRARIDDAALKRVTRSYSASLADIFAETLQNARRAGATGVRVTLDGSGNTDRYRISVADDGVGEDDPSVLLSFGQNGWDRNLVEREDAAGMGLLSLARRGCTVLSRPRPTGGEPAFAGFRVDLTPAHFLGEAEAEILPDDDAPPVSGTAVSFLAEQQETAGMIRSAIESAARHYPLPVRFEHRPHTPDGGECLPRRGFLDDAVHTERWRGLVFGVFKNSPRIGLNDPDLNFHGIALGVRLPGADTAHGASWHVAADVENCPELELVLPARKEAVETRFLTKIREAARAAIFRAMAAEPDPRPAFDAWRRAREAGVDIAPPRAALVSWLPGAADLDDFRGSHRPEPIGPDALVVACDPEPPISQAFWRAAWRNGLHGRLFEMDRRLEGFDWYDALPRVTAVESEITAEGRSESLKAFSERGPAGEPPPQRPDAIRFRAVVETREGEKSEIVLPADLAFADEEWCWIEDARPLVAQDSDLNPQTLAKLLRNAYFSPSEDYDADSRETQRRDFEREALHLATSLLVSDNEARKQTIADVVARELFWLIPHGADIAVRGRDVTVTLLAPDPEPEGGLESAVRTSGAGRSRRHGRRA